MYFFFDEKYFLKKNYFFLEKEKEKKENELFIRKGTFLRISSFLTKSYFLIDFVVKALQSSKTANQG